MATTIGQIPATQTAYVPRKSTAGLDVELNRYKSKLSDQEQCSSAKTPEGRANIVRLQEKVAEIKNSIEASERSSKNSASSIVVLTKSSQATSQEIFARQAPQDVSSVGGNSPSISGSAGTIVNVYA